MYTDYTDDNSDNEKYYSDDDYNNNGQNGDKIKKIAIFVLVAVILVVLLLIIAKGCTNKKSNNSNNSSTAVNNQKPSIMIGRESLSLNVGESFNLQIDVLNAKSKNPVVSWKSDDTTIASVNDEGYVTAEGEGITSIRVYYKENNKLYTNSCIVTVTSKNVGLESISLTEKEVSLNKGKIHLIEVTTSPKDAKVDKLIYESADKNIVDVSNKGYMKGISVGTTTITVKTEDGQISDTMTVTVSEEQNSVTIVEPTQIELIGLTSGLTVGSTTQAVYNITPNSATNKNVTWKSSNTSIATVDNDGNVRGISAGTCIITVTTSNNISSSKEVIVSPNTVSVDNVTINGSTNITMKVNGTKRVYYTISPENATNKKVSFKSSDPSVVFIDSNGIMGALKAGTALITITTQDGQKTAVLSVTVYQVNASGTSSTGSTSSTIDNNYSSSDYNYQDYYNSTNYSYYNYTSYENDAINSNNFCDSDSMISITHNEKGVAIVSSVSFNNTKPFIKTGQIPILEVLELNCSNSLSYSIYYGKDINSVSDKIVGMGIITKVGNKIKIGNNDGYYKVVISGKNNENNINLSKTYYVYVKTGSSNDFIDVSATDTSNGKTITIKKKNTNISKIYYCVSKTNTDCTPSLPAKTGINNSKTTYYGSFSISSTISRTLRRGNGNNLAYNTGSKVCYKGYNGNILVSNNICVEI